MLAGRQHKTQQELSYRQQIARQLRTRIANFIIPYLYLAPPAGGDFVGIS